jgi:glycosyltransferase involved in cell wall biosynthesis
VNILYSSDVDLAGSGYWRICHSISSRMVERGHTVVVLGNEFKNQQHDYKFTLVPSDFTDLRSQVEAIKQAQWPDYIVGSWDVPAQNQLTNWFAQKGTAQYIGIFPIEAGPLKEIEAWVSYIRVMDKAFVISEFGLNECKEAGLENVTFLPVGIDPTFWQPLTEAEREDLRRDLTFSDKFVVLTVADNQGRKNLSAGLETIAKVIKTLPNVHYIIIARPHPRSIGWSLPELAKRYGIENNVTIVHSRPSNDMLLRFYQASDAYFCTSHAEGLGLPILEAQACKVPVISGAWTAMGELIADGRGLAVNYAWQHTDAFGNTIRFWIDTDAAAEAILQLAHDVKLSDAIRQKAFVFAQTRTFDRATDIFEQTLLGTPATPVRPTLISELVSSVK